MATKIKASNLHTDVKTMMQTMVDENAVDSADVSSIVDANIASKSTSDISEGSNLYYTDARVGTYVSGNRTYGNITTTGTIDGRDVAADGTKLDTIETNATADQTGAQIKVAYEAESDTNAFTDADHSKLDAIEAGATADQTAAQIKVAYESNSDTNEFSDAEQTKLSNIEASATADQTAAEIRTLVGSATDSNVFTDADHSKLNAIAAGATNYGNTDVQTYISGSRSYGNITTTGYLRGPATFTIDPAAHGDNTGTLVVAGNLQVDGTTTTINSTTVAIDDLNFSIATDAASSSAANGAGITVGGAGATLLYTHATTSWDMNKPLNVTGDIGVSGTVDGVDIAARDAILTSTTTTAGAALPKAGGTLTGDVNFNDFRELSFGASDDLRIYTEGTGAFIRTNSGDMKIRIANGNLLLQGADGSDTMAKFVNDGAAELYYDNSKKIETTATGINVTGNVTPTGSIALGDWTITEDAGGKLSFAHSGTVKMTLDDTGTIAVANDVLTDETF